MTDRGIIFSGTMVTALLEGRKTQTRRLATSPLRRCAAGDRLWVRETFRGEELDDGSDGVRYIASGDWLAIDNTPEAADAWLVVHNYRKRRGADVPAIHMPRWASRITLIITDTRRQPLQAISDEDAKAEGVYGHDTDLGRLYSFERAGDPAGPKSKLIAPAAWERPRHAYGALWRRLHGEASWAANPEVVALTFRVERQNIDKLPRP